MNIHRINAVISASTLVAMPLTAAAAVLPSAAGAAATKRVSGPSVHMRWGNVRVTIVVRGKRIVDVKAAYPTERPRSARINQRAIPTLRSEVLRAQSARISAVSGATNTSDAYDTSLAAAIRSAHI